VILLYLNFGLVMYFWIFSFRELLTNLDVFIQSASEITPHKKIHLPSRLWKKPKKFVSTAQKYNNPLAESSRYEAWRYFTLLDTPESRFAFKAALAVSLVMVFQYIPATSAVFTDWRGEWSIFTVRNAFILDSFLFRY
jgi:hypothetical protein